MERPLQVLHLEDDIYDAELIEETLKAENIPCLITHVTSRVGYIQALEQINLDLILADFALPVFNGFEALALAQEKCPDTPFIFVSGAIGEEMAIESLKQGATDYVLKHRLSSLAPAVHRALREVEDRTQRRQAEEQLRQSKDQLEAILSGITEGITVQTPGGNLIYANETAAQIAGYPSVETLLQAALGEFARKFELFDEWGSPFPFDQLPGRLALQGQQPEEVLLRFRYFGQEEERWSVVNATPIFDAQGEVLFAVNVFRDVTERTRLFEAERAARAEVDRLNVELEQRVQQRTAQVRRLASELIGSEQSVRQRIARTLHDTLQQTLVAAKIQLHFLRDQMQQHDDLDDLAELFAQCLNLTRQLTVELSPPILEEEDLPEVLRWLAAHMQELYGLRVAYEIIGQPQPVSKELRVLLYQIVRELLFNVVKHARVQEAELTLQQEESGLSVIVKDGGQGFDMAALSGKTGTGYGLYSVGDRLQLFDGQADIQSAPGDGTQIRLFLPLVPSPGRRKARV
ncbi:MAG: response regulator [Anaerolineaceae bacterium]|nr:response regulator [Anaerolineaceae bacterium]